MAIALAFRVAIALAPHGVRVLKWAEGSGPGSALEAGTAFWNRLTALGESDEDLSAALSDHLGTLAEVATYDGDFEVRRLQVSFKMDSNVIGGEDVRVITFHLIKLDAGAPVDEWVAADFTAARARLLTFWTAIAGLYNPKFKLTRSAFYRAGPGIVPPQPPVNAVDHDLAGTLSAGFGMLPPQVAISVTEQAGPQRNWGRWFLPACRVDASTEFGRISSTHSTTLANAADAMYEGWRTDGTPAVVYLEELPARSPTAPDPRHRTKGTYPPRPALARTVDQLQIDDVFDVIRTRRYDRPLLRTQRAIG